ncbi:MAG: hypothetical protein QOC77_3395 [Thermoleophilaceae bacterium]|jgi:hypothetical protein|nr:hypothetical protein [Thermoleophilaceae bacterium]
MATRLHAFFAAASMTVALGGCAGSDKTYDISPIFPASPDKCARYHGDQKGSGIAATCMVNQDECKKAAADWRNAMASGGINDAIQFTCN